MTLRDAIQEARMGKNCSLRCPAHEDHNPSLSVRPGRDGRVLIKCHRGCANESVLAAVGLGWADVCVPRASVSAPPYRPFVVQKVDRPLDDASRQEKRAKWPEFETPTERDLNRIATIRGLGRDGLEIAVARGILWVVADFHRHRCWVVTDSARLCAQARRLDGCKFNFPAVKALTLPGSIGSWPVGVAELRDNHRSILLTEGGPDLIAAHQFIAREGRTADAAAIGMLGSSFNVPADLLFRFAGKRVRIPLHVDEPGEQAAQRWARHLRPIAECVDGIRFCGLRQHDERPVEDLNDFARIHPDEIERHPWTRSIVP